MGSIGQQQSRKPKSAVDCLEAFLDGCVQGENGADGRGSPFFLWRGRRRCHHVHDRERWRGEQDESSHVVGPPSTRGARSGQAFDSPRSLKASLSSIDDVIGDPVGVAESALLE
jgi:hypothetical protein